MKVKRIITLALLFLTTTIVVFASGTEEDVEILYKYQFNVDLQFKLAKDLKLNIAPEIRFNDGYDKFLLDGGLSYKTFGCITWGATYRLVVDRVESATSSYDAFGFGANNYDSELYHRYAFNVTYKDKFGDFTPSFRLRYNNYADDEIDDEAYLRYKAKVEYDIPKCKVTPFLSAEAYQDLSKGEFSKVRYSTGIDLKCGKDSALSFDYKLDFFLLKYKNANIFSVGYKYKF
ncbi:MAG: DUF2490 domain-containing protein [Rikenellaceae bacterium]